MTTRAADASPDLLARFDAAPLTPRYWATFGLIMLQLIAEIFDFFVVAFLVSAVAPLWKLTFGQSTVMLLSAGLGTIFGAPAFGWIADRWGRKPVVVIGGLGCCLCAGALAFTPDGAWLLFALLRFMVGFFYGGAGASQFALVVEYTPSAKRTLLTSFMAVPAGMGVLVASVIVSSLFPALGWRGVAALGFIPIVLPIALAFVAPESVRWLAANGKAEAARRAAASMLGARAEELPLPVPTERAPSPSPLQLFGQPRRFWLVLLVQLGFGTTLTGVVLWGPTLLAQLLGITPAKAATYFIGVSLAGLAGRTLFTFVAHRIGRVPVGLITAYAGAALLAMAGLLHGQLLWGAPLFFVFLLAGHFFYDGAYANLNTYAGELYPVRLAALAQGLSAASGGLGKILGPLALGLMAGAGNLVTPKATEQAVLPAFLFMAACCLAAGLAYSFLGVETNKRPLALA